MDYRCIILSTVFVSGCAFNAEPLLVNIGNSPLSDTTVFAVDNEAVAEKAYVANIQVVDGQQTPRSVFPVWVRLKPGKHDFVVRYGTNYSLGVGTGAAGSFSIQSKETDIPVTIPEMKRLHVYVARFHQVGQSVQVRIEDLGERPSYGKYLGGELNRSYNTVKF